METPYEVVARALDINITLLDENSAQGETPNWDSLNQVDVIYQIESSYDIQISDEDIEKYSNMKAIIELFKNLNL